MNSLSFVQDREQGTWSPLFASVCLFAFVSLSTYGAIELTWATGRIAAIWLSNAITLAFLLHHPRRNWPALLVAFAAANITADLATQDLALTAVVLTLCNVVEILVVAIPLRMMRLDRDFAQPRTLLVFYALAALPAPAISAILSASYFYVLDGADFGQMASNWFAADALGLVIFVPPLMTVHARDVREMFARETWLITVASLSVVIATMALNFWLKSYPLAFLFFPAVVLMTFQRGFAGGTLGLLLVGVFMLLSVFFGSGSTGLAGHELRTKISIIQIFVAVTAFTVVLVGAVLEQRRKLERSLSDAMAGAENSREEALVAKDAAEQASRTKSMFLANMSHELRTPLNAVIGFSEMMHEQMYGPLGHERYRDYSGKIRDAGRHLLELINDVLDMSKIEAGKLELRREEILISPIVRDCVAMMSEQARQAAVTLRTELPSREFKVAADKRAMKQVLLNLLSNAVKFTLAGGAVTARVRFAGGKMVLSVSDTGIGIPSDQLYRLGNPFVQLRNEAGSPHTGTGLGLALVRSLAELHKGAMHIESAEGRGTTVSVEIPALDQAPASAAA
ncbi:MAG: MASE1 domain-containing protein [Proteobacteria bacterium]|nr:MASE1 domain-containing protein [Pseudomonadota bacterium]